RNPRHVPLPTRRSGTATAITAVIALAALATPASASTVRPDSSGGGCSTTAQLEACISSSGAYVEPDAYILSNRGCQSADLTLWDDTANQEVEHVNLGCAAGHHGPFPFRGVNGHTYSTSATITASPSGAIAFSPQAHFSD
ncbi:hypothetical protein, partial [Streptacidiphilus anmyonensis]|uniref:hypothetical protein n=1 Tax=Streptacidiphilus anmyonensis TaxID=405782 RepID=UPI001364C3BA